jgi:hypothetical protein
MLGKQRAIAHLAFTADSVQIPFPAPFEVRSPRNHGGFSFFGKWRRSLCQPCGTKRHSQRNPQADRLGHPGAISFVKRVVLNPRAVSAPRTRSTPLDPNGKTVAANLSRGDRFPLSDRH